MRLLIAFGTLIHVSLSPLALADVHTIQRPDGSGLVFYYDKPALPSYPILALLEGSLCRSGFPMYQASAVVLKAGIAILTVEKKGLTKDTSICPQEYLFNNTIDNRVLDHLTVVAYLRQTDKNWNRKIGWTGGSEGGEVASLVAPLVPETALLAILASGGGLTMADELLLLTRKRMEKEGASSHAIQTAQEMMRKQFENIFADPTPLKEWLSDGKGTRNTYRWWSIILKTKTIGSLLALSVPIYIAHGTADTSCPIESSDIVAKKFEELGKTNIRYRRYEGLEHNFHDSSGRPHPEVIQDAQNWIVEHLR